MDEEKIDIEFNVYTPEELALFLEKELSSIEAGLTRVHALKQEAAELKALADLKVKLGKASADLKQLDENILEQARLGAANTLKSLGDLENKLDNFVIARIHYEAALALFQEVGASAAKTGPKS